MITHIRVLRLERTDGAPGRRVAAFFAFHDRVLRLPEEFSHVAIWVLHLPTSQDLYTACGSSAAIWPASRRFPLISRVGFT